MSDNISILFREEIDTDERILWSGLPKQGLILRPSDAFVIPFSLLWGGFTILWETMAVTSGAPISFMLWGIPFVLVGLYLIVGRFFVDAKQREKTYYALTNERVIILSGLFRRDIRSLNLKNLSDINLSVKNDASGTIMFGPSHPMAWWYSGLAWPGMGRNTTPAFEMINNAKRVYDLLRKAQREL
jgi:hypothetical protein